MAGKAAHQVAIEAAPAKFRPHGARLIADGAHRLAIDHQRHRERTEIGDAAAIRIEIARWHGCGVGTAKSVHQTDVDIERVLQQIDQRRKRCGIVEITGPEFQFGDRRGHGSILSMRLTAHAIWRETCFDEYADRDMGRQQ